MAYDPDLRPSPTNPLPVAVGGTYNPDLEVSDANPLPVAASGYNPDLEISATNPLAYAASGYDPDLEVSDANPLPVAASGYNPDLEVSDANPLPVTVTIHETLILQPDEADSVDTYLAASLGNTNLGVFSALAASVAAVGGAKTQALLRFDFSSIPATATIQSAIVELTAGANYTEPVTVGFRRSLVEWYEGNGNHGTTTINGSTWNNRNHIGSVPWAGGSGGSDGVERVAIPTDTTQFGPIALGAKIQWDVTSDVQLFVSGTEPNYGWWICREDSVALSRTFPSASSVTATNRPKITVEYTYVP